MYIKAFFANKGRPGLISKSVTLRHIKGRGVPTISKAQAGGSNNMSIAGEPLAKSTRRITDGHHAVNEGNRAQTLRMLHPTSVCLAMTAVRVKAHTHTRENTEYTHIYTYIYIYSTHTHTQSRTSGASPGRARCRLGRVGAPQCWSAGPPLRLQRERERESVCV